MSFWRAESKGNNPHWLCLLLTATPVLIGIVVSVVWCGPVPPVGRPHQPVVVETEDGSSGVTQHQSFAARGP